MTSWNRRHISDNFRSTSSYRGFESKSKFFGIRKRRWSNTCCWPCKWRWSGYKYSHIGTIFSFSLYGKHLLYEFCISDTDICEISPNFCFDRFRIIMFMSESEFIFIRTSFDFSRFCSIRPIHDSIRLISWKGGKSRIYPIPYRSCSRWRGRATGSFSWNCRIFLFVCFFPRKWFSFFSQKNYR